jgi:hypothetical protein
MKIMRQMILVMLIFVGLLTINPDRALACVCFTERDSSVQKALADSSAVFLGKVILIEPRHLLYWSDRITFQVSRVWKGPSSGTFFLNKALNTDCDYHFELNQEYLVFAQGAEDVPQVDICSRPQLLSDGGADIQALGSGEIVTPERPTWLFASALFGLIVSIGVLLMASILAAIIGNWRRAHS